MTQWRAIATASPTHEAGGSESVVPLKWAHDASTGAPRYIHDPEVVDKAGIYICSACHLELTPVLAGQPLRVKPTAHFRHPAGALRDACVLVAARAAAVRNLAERGFIDLPRRTMSAKALGFSGEDCQVWVEEPAERICVSTARMLDHATAVLTLEDGRELLVDLTGVREPMADGNGQAVVTMALSDPALAGLNAESIRARLRILPDLHWCAHWNDLDLRARSRSAAVKAASDALDGWNAEDEVEFLKSLPPEASPAVAQAYRQETLLHREAKAALEAAKSINAPGLEVAVKRHPPDELAGEWDDQTIRKVWMTPSLRLELSVVQLERRLGSIVPDVVATLSGQPINTRGGTTTWVGDEFEADSENEWAPPWPTTLLVEVTVTHSIDAEKLAKIRHLNFPTLEIDLSLLGGRLSREQFRDLVVNQVIGKRWVHHPTFTGRRRALEASLDVHPVSGSWDERLREVNRPRWLAQPVAHWISMYLSAAMQFFERTVELRRPHTASALADEPARSLNPRDREWQELADASQALEAHGLPGGMDQDMIDDTGLLPRILSIQHNRGIGYAVDSGFQVLNAIMQSAEHNCRWHTLYTIAVKAYGLAEGFSPKQAQRYAEFRQKVISRVDDEDDAYRRPHTYDVILSALFPAMAPAIAHGYGRSTQP